LIIKVFHGIGMVGYIQKRGYKMLRLRDGFCPLNICFDPVTAAIVIGMGAAAAGGATAYSARQESKAAKKAAEAQERVGMAQIEQASASERLAESAARAKLKARQAGQTSTILTSPIGVEGENVRTTNILGV
jgi:hypothetical protein